MTCRTCQLDHTALKLDAAAWASLPLRGHQRTPDDDGTIEVLELRDAPCGSTLAKRLASELPCSR